MERPRARTPLAPEDKVPRQLGSLAVVLSIALLLATLSGTLNSAGAASSPGRPVITGLSASSGQPGQTITLSGTGFYSANGLIVATFGTHPAPTRCPTRKRCLVTIPTRARLIGLYKLRLHIEAGTSNAVSFDVL